eukprot:scaffold396254_cov31-Prasinocladus_malaysianus.AAC.1
MPVSSRSTRTTESWGGKANTQPAVSTGGKTFEPAPALKGDRPSVVAPVDSAKPEVVRSSQPCHSGSDV